MDTNGYGEIILHVGMSTKCDYDLWCLLSDFDKAFDCTNRGMIMCRKLMYYIDITIFKAMLY